MGTDEVVGTFEFDESDDPTEFETLTAEELEAIDKIGEHGFKFISLNENSLVFTRGESERRYTGAHRHKIEEIARALKNDVREHEDALGIVSTNDQYVEFFVRDVRRGGVPIGASNPRWNQSTGNCGHEVSLTEDGRSFHISNTDEKACIELSPTTAIASFLIAYSFTSRHAARPLRGHTLKVFFSEARSENELAQEAIDLTERLCFELDAAHGIQMVVAPRERFRVTIPRTPAPEGGIRVRFPKMRLPREVSALFSFAGEAADNPPFMFLSYYQVLEYHLPLAARKEGLKSIRRELQSLNFDEKDDASILRLLNCAERNRNSGEEDQMKMLITECVRGDILREFFDKGNHGQHFTRRGPISGVPPINSSSTNETLEVQVAKRVYALRNRIVHAKDNPKYAEMPVLLPRSKEAGLLAPDIHLVRLLAIEVVVDSQG
ncbi:hypothetical protein ABZ438_13020 [Streptomyces sp. NPDC005786]|uniref:hypothetical protein n=1 Tax=Streptomyces sp. NPDC005786 TaxID=3154891 RepID=UPI0033DD45F4